MTKETIDQNAFTWQEEIKKFHRRLGHIELLIGQLKDEINAARDKIPQELNNDLQGRVNKLEGDRKDLEYLIDKQEDIAKQARGEPLIIKPEDKK
jgi:hypothetical protein